MQACMFRNDEEPMKHVLGMVLTGTLRPGLDICLCDLCPRSESCVAWSCIA